MFLMIFDIAKPFIIKYFIDFVQNDTDSIWIGIGLALAFVFTSFF